MLKRLFYASASILMLALAYHLGAQSAGAQGQLLEGPHAGGGTWTAAVNRFLWVVDGNGLHQVGPAIPGTSPVVATNGLCGGSACEGYAFLANGDTYFLRSGSSQWTSYPNLLGGSPTPAQRVSIGQLKAQYRK